MLRTGRIEMRPATAATTPATMRRALRPGHAPRRHDGFGFGRAGLVSTGRRPVVIRWRNGPLARRAFFGRGVGRCIAGGQERLLWPALRVGEANSNLGLP